MLPLGLRRWVTVEASRCNNPVISPMYVRHVPRATNREHWTAHQEESWWWDIFRKLDLAWQEWKHTGVSQAHVRPEGEGWWRLLERDQDRMRACSAEELVDTSWETLLDLARDLSNVDPFDDLLHQAFLNQVPFLTSAVWKHVVDCHSDLWSF